MIYTKKTFFRHDVILYYLISFLSFQDPTWKERHPGVSNCILISDGKYEWFEKWQDLRTHKRGEEYDQLKEKFAQKLLDVLYSKVL